MFDSLRVLRRHCTRSHRWIHIFARGRGLESLIDFGSILHRTRSLSIIGRDRSESTILSFAGSGSACCRNYGQSSGKLIMVINVFDAQRGIEIREWRHAMPKRNTQ